MAKLIARTGSPKADSCGSQHGSCLAKRPLPPPRVSKVRIVAPCLRPEIRLIPHRSVRKRALTISSHALHSRPREIREFIDLVEGVRVSTALSVCDLGMTRTFILGLRNTRYSIGGIDASLRV